MQTVEVRATKLIIIMPLIHTRVNLAWCRGKTKIVGAWTGVKIKLPVWKRHRVYLQAGDDVLQHALDLQP